VDHRRLTDTTGDDPGPTNGDGASGNGKAAEHAHNGLIGGVRATDIEPFTGLRYLSKLFRFMAIILLLLLVAEIATGLYVQGAASIPTLLGEASRLIVLAGVLWGTGDLAHLLIDVGHDVRATRVLIARQLLRPAHDQERERPLMTAERSVAVEHAQSTTAAAPPPIP
jgi:hypothetical protein